MPSLSSTAADGIDPIRAAHISARIDRLPAVATVWRLVALLSIGGFFELYDRSEERRVGKECRSRRARDP